MNFDDNNELKYEELGYEELEFDEYETVTSSAVDAQIREMNEYEDNWYKKFSKMEAAMAKMQSKTNALSGLFGGN